MVATQLCKKTGEAVYTRQRVWMLMPKHCLCQPQRLSVHHFRLPLSTSTLPCLSDQLHAVNVSIRQLLSACLLL
jgi:hypothetical protein